MTVPAPAGNAKKLIASRQMRGSDHDEGITMRLRLMLATSALLVACSGERTRAADAPPEPEKVVGEGVLAVLPMHVASRIPLIEVRVGTSEPLNFVVDTGFEVNVLDVDVARRLKLPLGSQTKEDAPGGAVPRSSYRPNNFGWQIARSRTFPLRRSRWPALEGSWADPSRGFWVIPS